MLATTAANLILRRIAVAYLGSLVDGNASIARLRLGLRQTTVEGIAVWSPQCSQPVLSIDRVAIDVTLWNGIRRGIWLGQIAVDRPQIQLHFSPTGTLVTNLPTLPASEAESKPIGKLPFQSVQVRNARFAVHQHGRQSLDIDNVSLVAFAQLDQFNVTAIIPELFNGNCELQSAINLDTMSAASKLSINGVRVSSSETSRFPLVPASVNAHSWNASTSLEIRQTGSLSSFYNCNAAINLLELGLVISGQPIAQLAGTVTARDGTIKSRIRGRALGGQVGFDGQLGSTPQGLSGKVAVQCQDLCTGSLPTELVPEGVRTRANAGINISATLADGMIHLTGGSTTTVNDTDIYGVAVEPVHINLNVDGAVGLRAESNRSHGLIVGTVATDGVSLSKLAEPDVVRLPAMDDASSIAGSELKTPFRIPKQLSPSGRVRGAARVAIPLATILNPATFQIEGAVDATGVSINEVVVADGRVQVLLDSGMAAITGQGIRLHDTVANRSFSLDTSVQAGLEPASELRAELKMSDLAAATVSRVAGLSIGEVDGTFSAHAFAACPIHHVDDVEMWRGWADFRVDSIRVNNELLADCEARCEAEAGELTLQKLHGFFAGGEVFGGGSIALTQPYVFRGEVALHGASIDTVTRIMKNSPKAIAGGNADLSAVADGEIATQRWQARGTIRGSDLHVGSRELTETRLDFVASPNTLVVATPPKGFLGGDLHVTASLAASAADIRGPHVTGTIADIPVPVIAKLAGFNEATDGLVSCEFEANSCGDLSRLQANVLARSDAVAIRNTSIKNITGRIELASGQGHLGLGADAFGGRLSLEADTLVNELVRLTPAEWQDLSQLPVDASASVTNVRLHQLWPVLGQQNTLRPLKGIVNATVNRGAAERHQTIIANAQVVLRDLRWDNVLWSNQLRAGLVLGQNSLELRELTGPLAGGRLTGRGKVTLDAARNGAFELTATRVSLGKLLVPVDRAGELADGLVSCRMQGRLGRRPSGRGFVAMDRGEVGPITFGQLRVPVDWSMDLAAKSVQWRTTNAGLELGGGRVITNAKGRWNGKLDMSLASTARRVDTGRILKRGFSSGGGFLDGTMRMTARRASGPEDFIGTFDATLSDAQSLQMPVLSNMTKFLGSLPTATSFDESKIKGRLGNGIVHLDRVTMSAADAQILVEGTATLKGRLNLQVMAQTSQSGPADKLLELVDSPLMLAAPAPIAIVAKANDALKDRVIHLRIAGTTARPAVRLEPTRQLGQEAVKFFMNQTFAYGNKLNVNSF